jgi:hypothetical protein
MRLNLPPSLHPSLLRSHHLFLSDYVFSFNNSSSHTTLSFPPALPPSLPPSHLSLAATTYFSMLFLSDYVFSFNNFLGVTISVVGSLVYSYIELGKIRGGKSTKNDDSSSKDGEGNEKPAGKVSGAGNRHRPQGKR